MRTLLLASPFRRVLAVGLDLAWMLGLALPWIWYTLPPGEPAMTGLLLGGLALVSFSAVPFWLWAGATPGHLLLSLHVADAAGARRLSVGQAVLRWLATWGALLPAAAGLLWMFLDPRRQGWHDRLAGTCVVEQTVDEDAGSPSVLHEPEAALAYPLRHLCGELTLARSLWLNGVLLPLPLFVVLGALEAWTRLHAGAAWLATLALLLGWVLLLIVLAWGLVGVWRSGRRPGARAGPAAAARVAMALVLSAALLQLGLNTGPRLPELASLLTGRDPLGQVAASLSGDGRRLRLKGPLAMGDARRVAALMAAAPALRLVVLESDAGRLDEALQVARLVRARRLQTRASGDCVDVCPLAFLAGSRRQLLPGARLGLHRISAGPFNPPYQGLVNRALRQHLVAAGLTPHLATKAVATPPTALWFPAPDELSLARLVSVPERPLDVDLPGTQGATLEDYAEALSASPLWQALERRFPGAQGAAARRMHAASRQGDAAVQAAGHEVVATHLPGLLARASPENRWLFTEVLMAQIEALRAIDPAVCRGLLLGDAAAHRRLPPELAWREAEWLLGALSETPDTRPLRRPKWIELEVIRRTLGPSAPTRLAHLWRPERPPSPREPDCDIAHAMLSELGTLAAPQRRLALRLMYERE